MVKSGSYQVKQGNIFGRVGSGIGEGLADQLPKEIDRGRLAQGLEKLGKDASNLTPFQQFTRLASIPGVTPQIVQSGSDLLRHQNIRNAYTNKRPGSTKASPEIRQDAFQPGSISTQSNQPQITQNARPSDFTSEGAKASSEPTIVERNPLSPELIPRKPWSNDRRLDEIGRVFEEIPGITLPEAQQEAAQREQRELAQPQAEQAIDDYYQQIKDKADTEFDRQFQIKTQKKGDETFKDLPGAMQLSLKRGMAKDLIKNSKLSLEQAADKWTEIGLNNAKALGEFRDLASESIFSNTPDTYLQKLKSFQVPFSKAGNKESYQNYLIKDVKLSPQRAAEIAYPKSQKISDYVNNSKRSPSDPKKFREISRKRAVDIQNLITSEDSLLAIARAFKDKDPYFDEKSFFNQLREDQDQLPLTPRQIIELGKAESSFFPNWADLWLFPWNTGIKTGSVK